MSMRSQQGKITIDIHTRPEVNERKHWRVRQRRAKSQRWIVDASLRQSGPPPCLPCVVTLTRLSSGELDTDNLAGALKHVRDAFAHWAGCGDSPRDPIEWQYAQDKCRRGQYAVRIEWRHEEGA